MKYIIWVILGLICFIGCKDEGVLTPKPRMFPRIIFPEKAYESVELEDCNFKFQKAKYATVKRNMKFFDEVPQNSCWFDLFIKDLNTSIHFSYSPINSENPLDKLVTDAFRLVAKHNTMADYRDEIVLKNPQGLHGLLFKIEGPVASPVNFYLTDSTAHFMRAAVYFNSAVNPDSIAPVLDFVGEDIDMILKTFEFQ